MESINNTLTFQTYEHAKFRIPSGTQLLSKNPDMMAPGLWPAYFQKAVGCETWDLDGRHYYDMSTNGIGTCLLGFRDNEVTEAVLNRIQNGSMCSLNPPEEVELADMLCEMHPWAQQARFTRSGGEACAVAVRIARAVTNRSIIVICGYHGWHDWYLACNLGDEDSLIGHLLPGLEPSGVPKELRGTSFTFRYNHPEELDELIDTYGDKIAAVIMEPCRNKNPAPGFLEHVREQAHRCGALLIFDEVTIGFRLCYGGAHLKLGVYPDIAVFAKALGNGHPIGAVIGTKEAMQGAALSFISSTYWTEGVGPVAALATLKKMKRIDVPMHVASVGEKMRSYWRIYADKYDVPIQADDGYPALAHFHFQHEQDMELRTLYTQLMLEKGFLAGVSIYPTLAHNEQILALHEAAIAEVLCEISKVIHNGDVRNALKGRVAQSGFRRLL